jgi:hypothetical protein
LLHVEPVVVALEGSRFGNHAVARHNHSDGIVGIGLPHRAERLAVAKPFGNGEVGGGFSVRDFQQLSPHAAMEFGRSAPVERQVEGLPLPLKILLQLPPAVAEQSKLS